MYDLHFKVSPAALALCAGFSLTANAQTQQPEQSSTAASEPSPSEQSIAPGVMTRPPEILKFVAAEVVGANDPSMPRTERALVRLEFTVEANGSTSDVQVIASANPSLDSAAQIAVRQFVFRPAEIDGTPGAVRIQYEYVFEATPVASASLGTTPQPVAAPPPPVVPTGSLRGQLLQSGTRKPVIGATVELVDLGVSSLTDAQGRFEFEGLPVGSLHLTLSDEEHTRLDDHEDIVADTRTEVVYYTQPTGFETDDLVAVGRRVNKQVVRRVLTMRELSTVPGSNGDAIKAVQNLPGIARTTGDQVVMRGIGGGRVFVNGHPIAAAFHFFGLRSTVSNGMIKSLEVTPGNYDSRYGGTTAGVIDIQTRRPKTDGLHGFGQVDLFDTSVFLEGPVGDNGAFAVGGRRSYIDGVLNLALNEEGKETFQAAPRYYDLQASYDWKKGKNRFRLNTMAASDRMVLLLTEPPEDDPAARGGLNLASRWATVQALWDYRLSDKTQWSAGLSYLRTDVSQGFSNLKVKYQSSVTTLRTDLSHQVLPWLTLRAGLNGAVEQVEFDVVAPPPPGDGEPDPALSTQPWLVTQGSGAFYRPAGYVAADLKLGKLLIVPALRIDHFSDYSKFRGSTLLQPRLDAKLALGSSTTLKAGAGIYSAAADLVETNDVFGNPETEPEMARHYSAGVEQRFGDHVSVDVTGFYQDLFHQVSALDDPVERFDNNGRGRVLGAEFLLKHDLSSRFYGWVAYTLMRSERRESGQSEFKIYNFDQTHNLNVVGQYRLSTTWEVGGRFRYVTGNPSTPVIGAVYNSDADIYSPINGAPNSDRVPGFHQLDLRVDKHWVYDTWKLTTYVDVQNVYNRQNPEGVNYNYNFRQSKYAAGLPLLPSFGIKGEF